GARAPGPRGRAPAARGPPPAPPPPPPPPPPPHPWLFDVRRSPNPHLGFGGGGAHFCLGANLARREITLAFEELHRQIPDLTADDEPDRLLSAFIHGIKRLPVRWTPAS
ncbi:hypothetical protein AB4Z39_14580, partial [Mycobacterium adipatum]